MFREAIKRIILLFIILISFSALGGLPCYGQDQLINGRNTYIIVTPNPVAWSTLSNQVFYYVPLNPDQNSCLFLINDNPSSSHTFTINVFQTADQNVSDYSHNTTRYTNIPITVVSALAANTSTTSYFKVSGSAKVAIQFTGGSTQAGNPDTAEIFLVQTSSPTCGSIGAINNAISQGISSVNGNGISNIPLVASPGGNPSTSAPATGSQATNGVTAVSNVRHIATCVGFSAGAVAAPVATQIPVVLRDGASGVGTIIMQWTVNVPASTGQFVTFMQCGLNIVGTTGNAMVLEFANGLANLNESIELVTYNVN